MVRRVLLGILIAAMMIPAVCGAELSWTTDTPAQQQLKNYIESANQYLKEYGELPVNRIFEMYPVIATLGIVKDPKAEAPEDVEITVNLLADRINSLQLRVCDAERFPQIAAGLIRGLYKENITPENAIKAAGELAEKATKEPKNSYEEPIEAMSGRIPRFYYAYYPDQYHDGRNWLQMTMIFPMDPEWTGGDMIVGEEYIKGVDPDSGVSEDYEGYYSEDDYSHFEVFVTATPEPDSAAAEYDFR